MNFEAGNWVNYGKLINGQKFEKETSLFLKVSKLQIYPE